MGKFCVRLKPAARTPEQIVASEDDLREIINAAMAAECAVCLKDDRQAQGLQTAPGADEHRPAGNICLRRDANTGTLRSNATMGSTSQEAKA